MSTSRVTAKVGTAGITVGSCLAMILSWDRSHSILWAILHCLFSWAYVVYYAITR
jgi:hypothetical protein